MTMVTLDDHFDLVRNQSVVVLSSGGLDSTTLLWWLDRNKVDVYPLFVDYGQHCVETERSALLGAMPNRFRPRLVEHDIRGVFANSSSRMLIEADLLVERVHASDLHVPYRNSLLILCAAAHAETIGAPLVAAAFINSNIAVERDCRWAFFNALNAGLLEGGRAQLIVPFADMSKRDVVQLAVTLNVPLGQTYSCQLARSVPCGACPKCFERNMALRPDGP